MSERAGNRSPAGRQPKKRSAATAVLTVVVRTYQRILSPFLPPCCRYVPTCSQYTLDALDAHGALRGTWMGIRRILRCHPLGGHGFDPVNPPRPRTEEEVGCNG